MATLYRKYRPQNWEEVVNQNHIKVTLTQEIAASRTAHAYLFSGPRGVGKTTIARVLAKSVNCENIQAGQYEPCGKCSSCREVTSGRDLDIIEIDAASHTGVDNVRENIIAAARISPSRGKYKVFIIDEVHMLSISAFNALLKILEEPPSSVIFVLCTTEVHKIPTTIISRCERFDFKRINVSDLVKKLTFIVRKENIKVDKKILEAIARHSEGHMRDAESLLGQVVAIGGAEISQTEADLVIPRSDINEVLNLLEALTRHDAASAIELVNKLIDEGLDLKRFLTDFLEMMRKLLLIKINPTLVDRLGLEMGEQLQSRLKTVSDSTSIPAVIRTIEEFQKAKNSLTSSFISQLPLEIAIVRLCSNEPESHPEPTRPIPPRAIAPEPNTAPRNITPAPNNTSGQVIRKEDIMSKWHEVLAKIKQYNHSLSFILRVCEPKTVNGNQLCLAFKYKFHNDRMKDMNIRTVIEKVLNEVYGQPLTIESVIDETITTPTDKPAPLAEIKIEPAIGTNEPVPEQGSGDKKDEPPKGDDNMIDNLLKTFGGKVIS